MDDTIKELRRLRTNSSMVAADMATLERKVWAAMVNPDVNLSEVLLFPLNLREYASHLMRRFDTAANAEFIRPALVNYLLQGHCDPAALSKDAFANHFLGQLEGQLANRVWDAADVVLINSGGMGLLLELFVRQQAGQEKALAVQMFWLPHEQIDLYRQKLELDGGLRRNLLGSPDEAFTALFTADVAASPLRVAEVVLEACLGRNGHELPRFADTARIKALETELQQALDIVQFHRQLPDTGGFAVIKQPDLLDEWMLSASVTGWRDA